MSKSHKIVFAAGGTGGHLFPAQALARQFLHHPSPVDLMFAGANLSTNLYFDKDQFPFCDVASTTPFRGSLLKAFKSVWVLFKGTLEALRLFSTYQPDLVVGFGSFHAFPVLCAAVIKKIPIVLFESNAIPGRVIRLFSKKALFTGIFFSDAKEYLKGRTAEVEIPMEIAHSRNLISKEEARVKLSLNPDLPTLLVFGGSQGSKGINRKIIESLPLIQNSFQLIHFTGSNETAVEVSLFCRDLNLPCYVKKFESQMDLAWRAADLAVCRSGAMTLSEILHYEVPAILIPYPTAAHQHQLKNALFLEREVGGAIHFIEEALSGEVLARSICSLLFDHSLKRAAMQTAIQRFKIQRKRAHLSELILETLENQ